MEEKVKMLREKNCVWIINYVYNGRPVNKLTNVGLLSRVDYPKNNFLY